MFGRGKFQYDIFCLLEYLCIGIRARPRQIHTPKRNARRFCLRFDEPPMHRVHSDPVRLLIERRKQSENFIFILLPEKVKAPSTVSSSPP